MAKFHLTTNIQGLLNNHSTKWLGEFFGMEGSEAREELERLKAKGDRVIGSEGCTHFDPIEGCRCRFYDDKNK